MRLAWQQNIKEEIIYIPNAGSRLKARALS